MLCGQLYAQETYIPMQSTTAFETKLIKACESAVETQLNKKEIKRNKGFKEFISERQSILKGNIQQKQYLFDGYFYSKCRKILEKITDSDTAYKSQVKDILVGRSWVPNAYCYGNGVLIINLGLISRFKNDDQMAFVIGHELAHQLLDHVDTKIKKQINYYNSKEYKKEIRKIKRSDYNQFSKYENFMLSQALNSRSYSRERERQADSLAVVLMKKAGYQPTAALEALAILDGSDQPIYNDTINFGRQFSSNGYKFNYDWLNKSNGLKVEQKISQELIDSLKTHPDCDIRANRLVGLFKLDQEKKTDYDSIYSEMQYKALMESIQYSLYTKKYGVALTKSLQLLNHLPDNRYLRSTVGICLGEIYFAQKEHTLREYVPRPDDDYQYNYHLVLLMIENMRLSELKELALSYMGVNNESWTQATVESEQHLIYHNYLYNKIKGETTTDLYKDIYLEQFPDGYFIHSFNLN